MDKRVYMQIRNSLDLKTNPSMLPTYFLQNGILIAVCFGLHSDLLPEWTKYICIPILAVLMFRGFSLMHDAVHRAVSKNRGLNDFVGVIAGGFCLLAYTPWKEVHLAHHRWSGNVDNDPVMALVRVFSKWPLFLRILATTSWRVWIPVLAVFQYVVFWWHSSRCLASSKTNIVSVASVLFPVSLWGGLAIWTPQGFMGNILVPSVILYLIAVEVVNFPHHLGLPYTTGQTTLPVWNQHEIARTCVYPAWISRFIALNFNFHIEHHMFPDVSWYHLDKLHLLVKQNLDSAYNLDPQFAWVIENRQRDLDAVLAREDLTKVELDPLRRVA